MKKVYFGATADGQAVHLYTLKNGKGMTVSILDLGATIVSLEVPNREGKAVDVVLGYDTVEDYQNNTCCFGAVIGPNANRIAGAACTIDHVRYELEKNDHGNNLHSGKNGFQNLVFAAEEVPENNAVVFFLENKDGAQGFPGNQKVKVTYTLTEENELVLHYEGEADKKTVLNLTNHTYFNLNGHASGTMEHQELLLAAASYTPVIDAESIPTGEIAPVAGTPMDFTAMKPMGRDSNADFDQLLYTGGYDHNYVLDHVPGQPDAKAYAAESGIAMEMYTDLPGVQFYAGNFIQPHPGKGGAVYDFRHGFCLETQYFPDAVNQKNFASPVLQPGQKYDSTTVFRFGIE